VQAWAADDTGSVLEPYAAGTWGPAAADELLGEGRSWRNP
jgi:glucose-6-phosphate 1-dehydrogenase